MCSWEVPQWGAAGMLAVLVLLMQAGCATGYPLGGGLAGSHRYRPLKPSESPEARERMDPARSKAETLTGLLVRAGVPSTSLPGDGRTLSPAQALEVLPSLLSTPVTPGHFAPRRMAAHLLLEVAAGSSPVSLDELHARMRRFGQLLVLRPDGYLVKPDTGGAVQKAGEVALADDGTLRAGPFEVGPFYAIESGRLFPVDGRLEVPHGVRPAGLYVPDDGVTPRGADSTRKQAGQQAGRVGWFRVRWHVADSRRVAILEKLFQENHIEDIEIVYTPPRP
ncbi:MAG TPA: hypothetical protein VFZ09_25825 [Archangium sp.]|uniref:hypothetical protein n=1 Tax=Archangium sp. TaxID=1872627 RepID=UPI002E326069|nr:hypothetical protein [Archangium sp.]HEX5749676.1 hypothetical protein [Archangium sp.]